MGDLNRTRTNFENANNKNRVTFFYIISNELKRIFFE
jgi:hypothetical protein